MIYVNVHQNDAANNILQVTLPTGTNGKIVYMYFNFKFDEDFVQSANSGIKDFATGANIGINSTNGTSAAGYDHQTIAMIYLNGQWWAFMNLGRL